MGYGGIVEPMLDVDKNYIDALLEEEEVYDYSHFNHYNELPSDNQEEKETFFDFSDLESSRVVGNNEAQGGPGQIEFVCKINLAIKEVAVLNIKSYLYKNTLVRHYPGVAEFEIPSTAEIKLDESITVEGSNVAQVKTIVKPNTINTPQSKNSFFICVF